MRQYIITEEQLKHILTTETYNDVRSHPYNPQVEPWCYPGCYLIGRAKHAEREKVLDDILQLLYSGDCPKGTNNDKCDGDCVVCCVNIIRRESKVD